MPRILLVEDDPSDRLLAERGLEPLGLELAVADTADSLAAALRNGGFDVVVTDYYLGFSDGLEVFRRVQAKDPDVPVIMFTLSGSEEVAVEAMHSGLEDYVLKAPKHLPRLRAAVERALRKRAERLRHRRFFDAVPVAVYRQGLDGRILEANPALAALSGYPLHELVGLEAGRLYLEAEERRRRLERLDASAALAHRLHLRRKDGRLLWVEEHLRAVHGPRGQLLHHEASLVDAGERARLEDRFRALVENSSDLIYVVDARGVMRYVSPNVRQVLGYDPEGYVHQPFNVLDFVHPEDRAYAEAGLERLLDRPGESVAYQARVIDASGGVRRARIWGRNLLHEPAVRGVVLNVRDVTEEEEAKQALLESEALFRTLADTAPALILLWQEDRITYANRAAVELSGHTAEELLRRPFWDLVHPDDRPTVREHGLARLRGGEAPGRRRPPFRILARSGEVRWLDYAASRVGFRGEPAVLVVALDVTTAQEHRLDLEALARVAEALRRSDRLRPMLEAALDEVLKLMNTPAGSLLLYDPDQQTLEDYASRGWIADLPLPATPVAWAHSLSGRALRGREPLLVRDLAADPRVWEGVRGHVPPGWGGAVVPLLAGPRAVGVLTVAAEHPRVFSERELRRLALLGETVGNAVHRASLRNKLERRLEQLQSLRYIDRAISSSLDLALVLGVFLEQVMRLPLDAAEVLLYRPPERRLEAVAARGLPEAGGSGRSLALGQGAVGQAAERRETVVVNDLLAAPEPDAPPGFTALRALPLEAKGELLGVLAVYSRGPARLSAEEEEFLGALATQGAIAIENSRLFGELERAKEELEEAYDLTLWGWAKAVELRDQETAGHTQRVTDLTLSLARTLGIPENDLVHVRRGAILHDVGKLGVPDAVLLKPGKLTEEEWAEMKKHPVHAHEWLSRIPFLQRALAIPYCHHERWDGSGYPRGLEGEEIPLEARIFAVVDVYDALDSDRPYRKAWPRERVLEHIREQAGRHFDPEVTAAFLELITHGPDPGAAFG